MVGSQSFLSASVLKTSSAEVTGVMGISRDISEQKKTEKAFLESDRRYRSMVESVKDYIYTVELENRHHIKTTHGKSCVAITGYTAKEYDADPFLWLRMIYEEDRDRVMDHVSMMLSGDPSPPIEHRITHKDGSIRWIRNTAVTHYDENGSLVAYDGLVRDITESKRTQDVLTQSAKLASVEELAANIAHEINNPMTSVLGYTSIILEDMEEGAPYYEDLKIIEKESLRVREIVRKLLDFARKGVPRKAEYDIRGILEDTVPPVNHISALADIHIEVNYRENLPRVFVDANQIRRVFINLIDNACYAMQNGGELAISTDATSERGDGQEYIRIIFKDTGGGIPEPVLERIFEPFYTSKGDDGNGLGLAVSYGIIKDHGGDILVRSKDGEGSEFTVMLPAGYTALPGYCTTSKVRP